MSQRLLVVLRALGLGDFLTGLPALRALADAFPQHRRVLAAPAALGELVHHSRTVHALAPTPGLVPLASELRGPDIAVDLHGRGPGSQPLLIELGPRWLLAWHHPDVPGTEHGPTWSADEHEVARWCRLLAEYGIPADPSRLELDPPALELPSWARGATVVHPGAAYPSRRWPATRFAAVARHELAEGRTVVVTGSGAERGLAHQVASLAGETVRGLHVVAGKTSLLDLAAFVASASRVVCGDTGVAHLATALSTPSVVLFGPTPPNLWGPPPGPTHLVIWTGTRGDPHGPVPDPGLLKISAADVLGALARLPDGSQRPASPQPALRAVGPAG